MELLKPNYYAIIPANVRYDSDISPNAKLLYGEITALCNQKGFCWATNEYFSTLYGVNDRTIQRIIKQLQDKNYIRIEIKDNHRRIIYIDFTNPDKNVTPGMTKMSYPYDKNVTHNNTENNKNEYMNENITNALNCDWLS